MTDECPEKVEPMDMDAAQAFLDRAEVEMAPNPIDRAYVFEKVVDFIHTKGDHSLERVLRVNDEDYRNWPTRLYLDIFLKLMLNGLGESQAAILELEKKVEAMKKKLPQDVIKL